MGNYSSTLCKDISYLSLQVDHTTEALAGALFDSLCVFSLHINKMQSIVGQDFRLGDDVIGRVESWSRDLKRTN